MHLVFANFSDLVVRTVVPRGVEGLVRSGWISRRFGPTMVHLCLVKVTLFIRNIVHSDPPSPRLDQPWTRHYSRESPSCGALSSTWDRADGLIDEARSIVDVDRVIQNCTM